MADTWLHWGNILLMWERSLGPLLTTWILDLSEGWMWRFSEPGWICPNSVGTKQPHWIPDRKCGEQIGEGTSVWAITPPEFSVPLRRMNEFSERNQAGVVRANDRVRNQHGKTWKVNEWLFDYSEIWVKGAAEWTWSTFLHPLLPVDTVLKQESGATKHLVELRWDLKVRPTGVSFKQLEAL